MCNHYTTISACYLPVFASFNIPESNGSFRCMAPRRGVEPRPECFVGTPPHPAAGALLINMRLYNLQNGFALILLGPYQYRFAGRLGH